MRTGCDPATGQRERCEANLEQLGQVSQWVDQYRAFWTPKLDALDHFLQQDAAASAQHKSPKTKENRSRNHL